MANRFLNNITINDQYTFPSSDGTDGQILSTTGAADGTTELQFIDQDSLSAGSSESTHILVKNKSGAQIAKGTPVYVTGETGNSGKIEIAPADAANEDKMPALGLLETTLNDNEEGFCVQGGLLEALATATIDGTSTTANDTVYVKAGGGLTMTKPTGTGLIQNIAKVARVHASNGSLVVSSILRTNDVPNLPTGKIWVGDGNTTVSDVVYLDETNERMGIGTTDPDTKLDVAGRAVIGTSNTLTNETNATVIGNSNNLTSDSIVDSNTNLVLGDYGAGRYANTVISDRTLRLGRADVITNTGLNTTGILNFNDSVEANSAFSNVGGIVGYFPPPTTTNDYYFISAFSENVNGSAFASGASPTASRYNMSTSPSLNCIGQKFDANTTNSGAVYITASNNSSTPSSRGIFTFDARHQNQNYAAPDGHALFEVTSGYGQTKFIIKQVNGSSNVGIGTTSPGQKLDVAGNIKMTETAATTDTDKFVVLDSGVLKYRTGSQVISDLPTDTRYVAVTGDTMTGKLFNNTSGSGQININNSQAVFGTHYTSTDIWMYTANGGNILLGGGIGGIQNDVNVGNGDFTVPNGNVGIGTTSPDSKLHVKEGDITIEGYNTSRYLRFIELDGSFQGGYVNYDGSSNILKIGVHNANDTNTANDTDGIEIVRSTGQVDLNYGGNKVFSTVSGGTRTLGILNILDNSNPLVYFRDGSNNLEGGIGMMDNTLLRFAVGSSGLGTDTKMVVKSDGNVGIGTDSPGKLLELKGGDNEAVLRLFNDQANTWDIQNSTLGKLDFIRGGSNTYMRIDQFGNVGINQTNPGGKLEVRQAANNGTLTAFTSPHIKLTASATADNQGFVGITAATSTADNYGYSFGAQRTSGGVGDFKINYHNNSAQGTNRFLIDQNGNVGIGETNPDAKLTVFRTDSTYAINLSNTEARAGLSVKSSSSFDSKLTISSGASSRQYIQAVNNDATTGRDIVLNPYGGNVGIGTTSNGQKLSVAPDTDVSAEIGKAHIGQVGFNGYAGFSHVDQNTQQGYALIQYSDGSTYMNANTGKNIRFRIANSDKMILDSSGRVGIGTTSPNQKLTIKGTDQYVAAEQTNYVWGGTTTIGVRMGTDATAGLLDFRRWVGSATTHGTALITQVNSDGGYGLDFRVDTKTSNTVATTSRMFLSQSGEVGIGTTSPSQKLDVNGSALVAGNLYIYSTSYYLDVFFGRIDLQTANGVNVRSGSTYKPVYASAFTVSSDYRLKSNIEPLENAISRVNQLEVHRFNWNDRLNEPKVDGFIAHEVAPIIPEAVLGEKDAVHEDGTPNHQGIDQAKIVPLLTAALQEAISKIENLEARIQILENQ